MAMRLCWGAFLLLTGIWIGSELQLSQIASTARADQPSVVAPRATFGVGQDRIIAELRAVNRTLERIDRRLETLPGQHPVPDDAGSGGQ